MDFGEFIGNAVLAPVGMVAPPGNHLLLNGRIEPPCALGRPRGKRFERRIATGGKARLPIIEGRAADMGGAAGEVDIAGRFPSLKQQPALLRRSHRKMDALLSHQVLRFAYARVARV